MLMRIRSLFPTRPDKRLLLTLCVPALDVVTPDVVQAVVDAIAGTAADNLTDDVHIVVAEAVNNIVEHAYPGRSFGALAVHLSVSDSGLRIDFFDWGDPFPDEALPAGQAPKPASLSEGGYGWFLIRALASTSTYSRIADSNCLSICFQLR